jgi:hypothetical protein
VADGDGRMNAEMQQAKALFVVVVFVWCVLMLWEYF